MMVDQRSVFVEEQQAVVKRAVSGCVTNALANAHHNSHLQSFGCLPKRLGMFSRDEHTLGSELGEHLLYREVIPQCRSLTVIEPRRVAG